MTRYRQPRRSRGVAAATSRTLPSFDDNSDEDQSTNENVTRAPTEENDENVNTTPVQEDEDGLININDEETKLKSNVWKYAKKISTEQAQCIKCKRFIKTICGGTTTLRKHLIMKHNLTHLTLRSLPRIKNDNSITREQKLRLDHLANLAVFEDGRTFGDLRRSGIEKFLAEAIPGYVPPHRNQLYGYFDPLGYSVLTTSERSKVERHLKQKSKEQSKSQAVTTASSMTTSSASESPATTGKSIINLKQNNQKPTRLNMFLKSVDKNTPFEKFNPKTISEEISLYGSLCKKHSNMDAITFWKFHGEQMPVLKVMAQRYLATPGTSVASESAFSSSAYIARKERARLSPENLSYTVFLQDKLRSPLQ